MGASDASLVQEDADPSGQWYQPTSDTTWQWQLQGAIQSSYDVQVYDIDLFDVSKAEIEQLQAQGRHVICYFSAGSFEPNRPDADQFPKETLGLVLEGFEEERWLDIRDPAILTIIDGRLDLAAEKGCDGVEPDNVDGYQNPSGFPLDAQDQLQFNKAIASAAHQRNLAVGLKNDLDQIPELVGDFDFSVNEQCHEFSECEALLPFINANKPVWNAEYKQEFIDSPAATCQVAIALGIRSLLLPLDLDDSFRISCD